MMPMMYSMIIYFPFRTLYTLESYRKKGYARLVLKILCKQIVEKYDIEPHASAVIDNFKSKSLLDSLGFIERGKCFWTQIK